METMFRPEMLLIILGGAVATYLTRIGGYLLIKRFKTIPPRVEAGLNAVPAAVLTTLVAPAALTGGPETAVALIVSLLAGLRFSGLTLIAIGWAVAMGIRHFVL
ncbi:AzlD family protein [Rhizobium sp. C4]|uniref:AzlD family protein n=1 Tax=Rhizobium sp. C4 TaxID=1349800 RepID=UPI001E455CA2|nr:AzlD family protein [Rhizobium sp. C4]MCD2173129.1 AzlD family protein [Rhizobium sp. C4]